MAPLETKVRLEKCGQCSQEILVTRLVIGGYEPDSTLAVSLTCWDCLSDREKEKYKERYNLKTSN